MVRLLRDREAPRWAKALVLAVIAYVVFPLDAVPDLAPYVGWIDDAGLILAMRVLFYRQLNPYRYPLGGEPPPRPTAKLVAVPVSIDANAATSLESSSVKDPQTAPRDGIDPRPIST